MNQERFNIEVEKSILRSKQVLIKKGKEYSEEGGNRLEQFYRAGATQNITPESALMGMWVKHVTSLSDMCKDPGKFKIEKFNEKITDIRNYTFLLDALLRDTDEEA